MNVNRSSLVIFFMFILIGNCLGDTNVSVSFSNRLIPAGFSPNPDISEGSIEVLFQGDAPIELLHPSPEFIRLNESSFTKLMLWNDLEPLMVVFIDQAGDTISVLADYSPQMPLDVTEHGLPIVHLQTSSQNLWDPDIGIYVWGNHENFLQHGDLWERPATFNYFEAGELLFSEPVGIRITGHTSRYSDQKGIRIYFDDYGQQDFIEHDFFGSNPQIFQRLILRLGRYPSNLINSHFAETLFMDLGHQSTRYQPLDVYLNNESWGIYCLRERYDDEYVEETYGVTDDYILLKDGESVVGDLGVWNDFLDSFTIDPEPESHDWFQSVVAQLDLATYIDWLFINIFGATTDNGYWWNVAQLKIGAGPWHFLMWDEDGVLNDANIDSNHFMLFSADNEEDFLAAVPPVFAHGYWDSNMARWNNMFHMLMSNTEFKTIFAARCEELLSGSMSVSAMHARLDNLKAGVWPGVPFHTDRWSGFSSGTYDRTIEIKKEFVENRHGIVSNQLPEFLDLFRQPVEVSNFEAASTDDAIELHWRTESEQDNAGFIVYKSEGDDSPFIAIASHETSPELVGAGTTSTATEYSFIDVSGPHNTMLSYQLRHVSTSGDTTAVNWIATTVMQDYSGLRLNELMADNDNTIADDHGEFDDWIEIFNSSTTPMDICNLYISDDPQLLTKHQMPAGIIIEPGGRVLLWADGSPEQGPTHLPFRLSADGETLMITSPDGVTIIDQVTFDKQLSDHVYQQYPENNGAWTYGWDPSPATVNREPRLQNFIRINELMSDNATTVMDNAGDYDPWVELHHPLPVPIDLENLSLTITESKDSTWSFSSGTLQPDQFVLVWMDNEVDEGPFHASLALSSTGGSLGLFASDGAALQMLHFPALIADEALAYIPVTGTWEITSVATPGMANPWSMTPLLVLNELLARNDSGLADETGAFEDWVEIYNPGPEYVDLTGMFLTDDLAASQKWEFPEVGLEPGAFLVVWCDSDPDDGPLHTTFKLSGSGEELGLFHTLSQDNYPIDTVSFGEQSPDVSYGRISDSGLPWTTFAQPTPGASNNEVITPVPEAEIGAFQLRPPYPNPFNPVTHLSFTVPVDGNVELAIYDLRGALVSRLVSGWLQAGGHDQAWYGRDDHGNSLASGVYFARLSQGAEKQIQRLVLVR